MSNKHKHEEFAKYCRSINIEVNQFSRMVMILMSDDPEDESIQRELVRKFNDDDLDQIALSIRYLFDYKLELSNLNIDLLKATLRAQILNYSSPVEIKDLDITKLL